MSWRVYAQFKQQGDLNFRVEADLRYGKKAEYLIGSVLMINPGSSRHLPGEQDGLSPASKDFTFRVIISTIEQAYQNANKNVPRNGYVKILNLFDLRESRLHVAIQIFTALKAKTEFDHLLFASLKRMDITSPWIWIGWGSENRHPDLKKQMKALLETIPADKIIGYKYPGQEVGYYHPKYLQLHPILKNIVVEQMAERVWKFGNQETEETESARNDL